MESALYAIKNLLKVVKDASWKAVCPIANLAVYLWV